MMAIAIYVLCSLTALACCVLLLRGYRQRGVRLLFWSGLCFGVLTLNNLLLLLDRVVLPATVSLLPLRLACGLVAVLLLLFGLIWEDA